MKKDYYCILGINRSASKQCVQRAFRERALRLHPDHAGPEATDAFVEAAEAYRVLSDPASRNQYDKDIENQRRPKPPSPAPRRSPPDPEPLLRRDPQACGIWPLDQDFPTGRRPSVSFDLVISRQRAMSGGPLAINLPISLRCPTCSGGLWGFCPTCHDIGMVTTSLPVCVVLPSGMVDQTLLAVSIPLGSEIIDICLRILVDWR